MNRHIKNILFIAALLFSFILKSAAISLTDNKTEIIIIGTVHKSTINFDSDSLLNILKNIDPDLILVECDSSYMTPDFKLKQDIKYAFPETIAITEFSKIKPVELRPYDINGRDNFLNDYKRRRRERNFFKDISALSRKGVLNDEAIGILNKVLAMMNVAEEMANEKASYINNHEGSLKIDTINYYTYYGLGKLIDYVPELSEYKSYWEEEHNYWEQRNNVMLENILKYKKMFETKKIVVLCGFSHKNILKNGLVLRAHDNLIVKEFWED